MELFNYIFNKKKYINNNHTKDHIHLISKNNLDENNIDYEHNDNTCLIINTQKKTKTRIYDIQLINFTKFNFNTFKLSFNENNNITIFNSTYLFYKNSNNFYIEFIKNIEFNKNNGKIILSIQLIDYNLINKYNLNLHNIDLFSIQFNYNVNNNLIYNKDIIKITTTNPTILYTLYLKKNTNNLFYIYKIIYSNLNSHNYLNN